MLTHVGPRSRRALIAISWSLGTGVATAATGDSPRASVEARSALEEIVVTAQRREERAQDVPLAITALDSAALSRIGFTNLSDLMENVPSLAITP